MAHEGQSTNRPPLLLGSDNYNFWKYRMKIFLQRDLWEWWVVENGPITPRDDKGVPKELKDMDSNEAYMASYNSRAMNTLLSGMVQTKIDKVSSCNTAKEVWDTLMLSHEGTSKVKEVKLSMLMQDYELFKLEKDETIKQAQARFLVLMNSLKMLDKNIPQKEINRKLLRIMPMKFNSKVTTLEDSPNIATMDTLQLFGELEEYESKINRFAIENDSTPKSKTLALHAESSQSIGNSDDSDEDIALLSRRLKELIRKKNKAKQSTKYGGNRRENRTKQNEDVCFECGKTGHFRKDCYQLKSRNKGSNLKEKKKSKAFMTWSDDESEIEVDSNDEIAQVCFMGLNESNSEDDSSEVNSFNETPNIIACDSLTMQENKKITLRDYLMVKEENRRLEDKNKYLKKVIDELMEEVDQAIDDKRNVEKAVISKDAEILEAKNSYLDNFNKVLFSKNQRLYEENKILKKEIEMRDVCLDAFNTRRSCEQIKPTASESTSLENEVKTLRNDLARFVQGEENLSVMLGKQKSTLDRQGIGYKPLYKNPHQRKSGKLSHSYASPFVTCQKCGKKGHLSKLCSLSKPKITQIWV